MPWHVGPAHHVNPITRSAPGVPACTLPLTLHWGKQACNYEQQDGCGGLWKLPLGWSPSERGV